MRFAAILSRIGRHRPRLTPKGDIIKTKFATLILIAATSLSAHAAGDFKVMRDNPFTRFNAADQALLQASIDKALLAEAEGQEQAWKNDKSRASGAVWGLARYQDKGQACRKLRVRNQFGKMISEGVFNFCKQPNGEWKLLGPDLEP